jgi:hypothetical protein
MTSRTFHVAIFVAVFLAFGVSEHGLANGKHSHDLDQLLSFTYAFDRKARPTIEAKLLQTPANHGRMLRLQADPGESAVSVDCPTVDGKNAVCRVVLTRAQANMENIMVEYWGKAEAIRKVEEIAVVRTDAEIPKTTATAFRDCLRVMIPEPGDPLELHSLTITDNDRIEFWLEEPNVAPRKGERAEKPGGRTKMLIRIGDLLARYCETPESERSGIAKQIEAESARILGNRNAKSLATPSSAKSAIMPHGKN